MFDKRLLEKQWNETNPTPLGVLSNSYHLVSYYDKQMGVFRWSECVIHRFNFYPRIPSIVRSSENIYVQF